MPGLLLRYRRTAGTPRCHGLLRRHPGVSSGGGGPQAPQSALPVGAKRAADPLRVTLVSISQELVHAVLAVSYAKAAEDVLTS